MARNMIIGVLIVIILFFCAMSLNILGLKDRVDPVLGVLGDRLRSLDASKAAVTAAVPDLNPMQSKELIMQLNDEYLKLKSVSSLDKYIEIVRKGKDYTRYEKSMLLKDLKDEEESIRSMIARLNNIESPGEWSIAYNTVTEILNMELKAIEAFDRNDEVHAVYFHIKSREACKKLSELLKPSKN
jgi:hypothetical protein